MHQNTGNERPISLSALSESESNRPPAGCEPLLTEKQLSCWLGISLPTLQRLRSTGGGPRFVRLSERRIGYRRSVVEQWLDQRTTVRVGREIVA